MYVKRVAFDKKEKKNISNGSGYTWPVILRSELIQLDD